MRRWLGSVLSAVAGLWCACALARGAEPAAGAVTFSPSVAEQYLIRSVNAERTAAGLPPVRVDAELQAAARYHALQMARTNTLSHRLPGEPDLTARGASTGAHFTRITENVAMGPSILSMHDALMRSEHHRENILDAQVNTLGVSVVWANGSLWAVEDFSRSVETLTLDEQEQRVAELLRRLQVDAAPSDEARATCGMSTGYVGPRPAFTMRYTTGDLARLPEQLRVRLQTANVRSASVGACATGQSRGGFTSYSIAVVLYR